MVETAAREANLTLTLKSSLSRYPGSVHWHFKQAREKGTLELTFWPERNRLWFKIQAGRDGPWIEAAVEDLRKRIETSFPKPSTG